MSACALLQAGLVGAVLSGCGHSGGASHASGASDAGPTVEQGYLAVQVRQCGQCHQAPGRAQGVLSGQTTPLAGTQSYGSNLTPDPDTGMDAWDAGSIAEAVFHSVDSHGVPLCPSMPAYADAGMSSDEALAIAVYLQQLTPVWHAVPASTCPSGVPPPGDAGP